MASHFDHVRFIMADCARQIGKCFKHSADVRITILARPTAIDDAEIIVSDDDIASAIAALERLNDKAHSQAALGHGTRDERQGPGAYAPGS